MGTIAKVDSNVGKGNRDVKTVNFTFSNSYITGGEPFIATQTGIGLRTITNAIAGPAVNTGGTGVYFAVYNATNKTIQAFAAATASSTVSLKEVPGTTDLSTFTTTVEVTGW